MSNPSELAESYRILDIKPGATLDEVEHAYEGLRKTWDPSRFANDEPRRRKAEKKLRQLNRAYERLSAELRNGHPPVAEDMVAAAAVAPATTTGPTRHWSKNWWFLWILSMLLAFSYLWKDSMARLESIKTTTNITMTNFPLPDHDPNSPTGYPGNQHNLVLPALGTDGQHWTMQTERMLDGREGLRVRHVDYDGVAPISQRSDSKVVMKGSQAEQLVTNGGSTSTSSSSTTNPEPDVGGRDVHWSSSLHWLAAGLAWIYTRFNHLPIAYNLEFTVQWANTLAIALVMFFVPLAIVRRFGSIPTALLAFCFVAVYPYYEFSFVGYFDHHGLVASFDLELVLFLAAAGAGWLRNENLHADSLGPVERALWQWLPTRPQAKRWMIASGIAVGGGLWISTASVIPALFGVGVAALISTGFFARPAGRAPNPAVKAAAPWIMGIFPVLCSIPAALAFGIGPAVLGLIAGGIAAAGMINGTLMPWLGAFAIAIFAFVVDLRESFWTAGHWWGVWGGIGGAALGAAIAYGLTKNSEEKLPLGRADPTLWRVWGASAGLASLFFYLLEYAPSHFTMRLEVNHPLYALALLGAGDVLCRLSWLISGQSPQPQPQGGFWRRQWPWLAVDGCVTLITAGIVLVFQQRLTTILPLTVLFVLWVLVVAAYWIVRYFSLIKFDHPTDEPEAYWRKNWLLTLTSLVIVCLLPTVVMLFGDQVFIIRPGTALINLHQDYILEFRSFMRQISTLSPMQIVGGISMLPLAAMPMALIVFAPELPRVLKAVLLIAVLPALMMLALAVMQIRWLGISCAMLCAALAVAALVTTFPGSPYRWREGFRRPLTALMLTMVLVPFPVTSAVSWILNKGSVGELDLQQVITRDLSERLRIRLGDETGVILSGPTTSTWMMYFGGFHSIGSLYWENADGLKAASEIYSAGPSWDDAKKLIDKYHVTHIAIFSWDPFAMEYARLGAGMRLPKDRDEEWAQFLKLKDSFILKLWLERLPPPPWLRYVPYQVPNSPLLKGDTVSLLEVVPTMTPIEAALRYAQYMMTSNNPEQLLIALNGQPNLSAGLNDILRARPGYYPALISRAMVEQILSELAARRGDLPTAQNYQVAYGTDAKQVYDDLDKANAPDFAFEDRVNLALLLYNTNHPAEAFAQIKKCFETATETDLRHLQMDRLLALLDVEAHLPADLTVPQKTLDFAMSLLPKPLQGQVLCERAMALTATDQAKAIDTFREALKLSPDFEPTLTALAKLLVLAKDPKLHNSAEAIDLANRAADVLHLQSPENLQILACASAEAGKFDDAIFYGRIALMFMEDAGNKEAIAQWSQAMKAFENHQTYASP
ncbi:MAG TPA: hypothetical protein VHC95_13350 [Opitutales bacterium]|nr:hypothetical protein [Opitutales bacterium]